MIFVLPRDASTLRLKVFPLSLASRENAVTPPQRRTDAAKTKLVATASEEEKEEIPSTDIGVFFHNDNNLGDTSSDEDVRRLASLAIPVM